MKGFYPTRLRSEITWNRFANMIGGAGNNLELDLVNEHLNNEFKGNEGEVPHGNKFMMSGVLPEMFLKCCH